MGKLSKHSEPVSSSSKRDTKNLPQRAGVKSEIIYEKPLVQGTTQQILAATTTNSTTTIIKTCDNCYKSTNICSQSKKSRDITSRMVKEFFTRDMQLELSLERIGKV